MFKKPFKVEIDAKSSTHEIGIAVHPYTLEKSARIIDIAGKNATRVIVVAALAKTASEIAIHIAKTRIK